MHTQPDPDSILNIPPSPHAEEPYTAHATVLEDVFEPVAAHALPEQTREIVLASEALSAPPAPQTLMTQPPAFKPNTREWGRRGLTPPPPPPPAETAAAAKPAGPRPPSPPPLKHATPPQKVKGRDRYGFGVQLMRVSPTWLVVGGVVFVSLIMLSTWLIKPARREEQTALAATQPPRNQATNQRPAAATNLPAQPSGEQATAAEIKPVADKPSAAKPEAVKPAEPKPVEAKPAEPKPQPAVPAMSSDGKFTVQVGSYPDESQARERVNRLKAAGFDGRVVAAQIPNRGTWYRVQAGRFAGRDAAALYGSQLRSKGVAESALVTEVGKQ